MLSKFACGLWGSRKYLSVREWGQILFILAVFIFSGDMLYAVLFGVILTCTDFILTYAKVPCVAETPAKGSVPSCMRRDPLLQNSLRHITDAWMMVVKLKGFVFFASAQAVVAQLREILDAQEKVPEYKRLRFLVFDCQLVDGMDASTAKTLRKLTGDARNMKISMLYTHATGDLKARLIAQELADENKIFQNLDDAEVQWCIGAHYDDNGLACGTYHDELRATAIFAVMVSSAALGFMFFMSGKFHLTRYASYVPTCVMEAFMSCVGYKVFKYALLFCEYEAQQFIPAACVGVPLYFVKAYHIGNPAVVIPLMLLTRRWTISSSGRFRRMVSVVTGTSISRPGPKPSQICW